LAAEHLLRLLGLAEFIEQEAEAVVDLGESDSETGDVRRSVEESLQDRSGVAIVGECLGGPARFT
jgi:hypothetical protein